MGTIRYRIMKISTPHVANKYNIELTGDTYSLTHDKLSSSATQDYFRRIGFLYQGTIKAYTMALRTDDEKEATVRAREALKDLATFIKQFGYALVYDARNTKDGVKIPVPLVTDLTREIVHLVYNVYYSAIYCTYQKGTGFDHSKNKCITVVLEAERFDSILTKLFKAAGFYQSTKIPEKPWILSYDYDDKNELSTKQQMVKAVKTLEEYIKGANKASTLKFKKPSIPLDKLKNMLRYFAFTAFLEFKIVKFKGVGD